MRNMMIVTSEKYSLLSFKAQFLSQLKFRVLLKNLPSLEALRIPRDCYLFLTNTVLSTKIVKYGKKSEKNRVWNIRARKEEALAYFVHNFCVFLQMLRQKLKIPLRIAGNAVLSLIR
jgi:hypothetical protein